MKSISSLFCAVLLGAFALAAVPVASQAAVQADGLRIGLSVGLLIGQQDDDRRHRRHDDNNNGNGGYGDRRDNRGDNNRGGYDRGGGGEQRDDRINRAISIGQSRGRVLNAWPQGGSLFMVRVDTPRGRVDMVIDVDSGRIVEER